MVPKIYYLELIDMQFNERKQWEDYLQLFKVEKNKYLIGVFQKGITFYKQQVRAINIFYGLIKTEVLVPPKEGLENKNRMKIGVIGGGIGGMTFAAVALKSGFNVTIFEQKPVLLHMQNGCETRKIHPNIYDWPEKEKDSLSPYAKIPVLSWKNDTASNVAKHVIKEYLEIHEEANEMSLGRSLIYPDCDIRSISTRNSLIEVLFKLNPSIPQPDSRSNTIKSNFDILIFAPGYGIEIGTDKEIYKKVPRTPSYWASNDFSQPLLSKKEKTFLIYGTGDGALMDLFRLKIHNFDLVDFLNHLKKDDQNFNILTSFFINLKDEWSTSKTDLDSDWLWEKFKTIDYNLYKGVIDEYILPNWAMKKKVIVIGRESLFEQNINLNKVSLLNAFISYLLLESNKLCTKGLLPVEYRQNNKRGNSLSNFNNIERKIIRFGTDRSKNLRDLKIAQNHIIRLKQHQESHALYDFGHQFWKYHEIIDLFEKKKSNKKIEYYRSETVAICSNFVSILSKVLSSISITKKRFRVALHRVIKVEDDFCYQQITSYFENTVSSPSKYRALGSVYPIDRGNVGFSIKSGKSLLIKRPDNKSDLKDLIFLLKLNEDFDIGNRKSFLTIPVLAKIESQKLATNFVLYLDSEDESFFDEPKVIQLIYNTLIGFLESINRLINSKQIHMNNLDFNPMNIDNNYSFDNNQLNKFVIDLSSKKEFKYLKPENSLLKTDCFYSYDIVYGSN